MNECENDVNHDLVALLFGELKTGEKEKLLRVKQKSRVGLGEGDSE